MKKTWTLRMVAVLLLFLGTGHAALFAQNAQHKDAAHVSIPLSVARIFSSNMVLQSMKPVPVWGKVTPGAEVSVSFAGQEVKAVADKDGNWTATLAPLKPSSENRVLTVKGPSQTIAYQDVLVGDVWVCSGQSNMEMSFGWGISDGAKFMKDSEHFPQIRHIKFGHVTSEAPTQEIPSQGWVVCSEKTLPGVTAAGYFFALKLHQELGIPIGIIADNWSGCRIEPFISAEAFRKNPALANISKIIDGFDPATESGKKAYLSAVQSYRNWIAEAETAVESGRRPVPPPALPTLKSIGAATMQYNAMIAPIVRFPIKGALWYQGCSNGSEDESYYQKMHALVDGWRAAWKEDFPFYFVQLASYTNPTQDPAGGNGYAKIRDAQRRSLDIPKSGMAVTIDIGDARDIHPKNKFDVGLRLALWALAKDYGKTDLVYSGPLYRDLKIEGDKIRVGFDQTGSGLMAGEKTGMEPTKEIANGTIKGFAIAGSDKVWHWADAVIDGKDVVLSSPQVKAPVAVRYAFRANPMGACNLYNKEGLPASPFRTDNW